MNISIGLLACNEAETLPQTLESLFQQSLFQAASAFPQIPEPHLEVIVVANGCTDATVSVAQATLEVLALDDGLTTVHWYVHDVAQPGKSHAWNLYVHDYAATEAEYLILMDADIQFVAPRTLERMIQTLEHHPEAWVSVDTPIKDIQLKPTKTFLEWLSLRASSTASSAKVAICGQLYCGRAAALRTIWMPPGLPVEDGFLRAMIVTNRFTEPERLSRIQRTPEAAHQFEAYVTPQALIRHEIRLVVGSTLNAFIYHYLWENATPDCDAGTLICHNNHSNPQWLHHLIQAAVQERGWWLIPRAFWFRRFGVLRHYSWRNRCLRFPLVLVAFCVDWWVFWQANRELHRQGGLNYW
ncbi:glycosyltransferase [Synechococcales cyanobacterium C]|uniref:Glycosyltransferase n=1 Tax=Petrachloros mirabilis ULC683 TaxID=2781853 RepID=A0A8K1ZZC2_9CYAN|nr:glycosyltransferase family 2 protein [Petrachloros mirabilis]NCJ06758.1 glycosyltransferase [Petrachloros mirabilis ULC683]